LFGKSGGEVMIKGMSCEEMGCGGKRINRINISVSNKTLNKIKRLSTSCNMRPTTLVGEILERFLNDPSLVDAFQEEYNLQPSYRVTIVKNRGKVTYALKNGVYE
jgi:hypothetical protein